jgi:DNA-directed RNA polymerase specialized sigma24 family protein
MRLPGLDTLGARLGCSRRRSRGIVAERDAAKQPVGGVRRALSKTERRVLAMYLDGKSYAQMAPLLGCSAKAVDNVLQRIRRRSSYQTPP